MKDKATIWTFTGLIFAAVLVGVLGFTSVGSTGQKARSVSTSSVAVQTDSATYKADSAPKSDQYQTTRVFWPIWNGKR